MGGALPMFWVYVTVAVVVVLVILVLGRWWIENDPNITMP